MFKQIQIGDLVVEKWNKDIGVVIDINPDKEPCQLHVFWSNLGCYWCDETKVRLFISPYMKK
jgi:hypothetical protein